MLEKTINSANFFLSGVTFITLGIFLLSVDDSLSQLLFKIVSTLLLINTLIKITGDLYKKRRKKNFFPKVLVDVLLCVICFQNIDFISDSTVLLLGFYFFCHALLNLVNFIIYCKDGTHGKLGVVINFFLTFILSIILFSDKNGGLQTATRIMGIYLLFYGGMTLVDFMDEILPNIVRRKFSQHIRIPLPIFLTFLIPQKLIDLINEEIIIKNNTDVLSINKENLESQLSVIIHLAKSGTAAFGHVEIAYKDKIYSYGNYNMHSRHFFNSIGEGIIAVADKNEYINYQVLRKHRYLVEFSLRLNSSDEKRIEQKIDKLINVNTVVYNSDLELAEMNNSSVNNIHDMSSELYKLANAKYYKIVKGKNKTFFVLKTNCVVVAESILRELGTFIPENGIIAPGTYYNYLNNEFKKRNGNVIGRKIYTEKTIFK